jgi:hypothetical protein
MIAGQNENKLGVIRFQQFAVSKNGVGGAPVSFAASGRKKQQL